MPVFNASVKMSGSIRMTRTGNQNGTALKMGAAGWAVRLSSRVLAALGNSLSIVSSAPCGRRRRIRDYFGGWLARRFEQEAEPHRLRRRGLGLCSPVRSGQDGGLPKGTCATIGE